jgi:hypothetical protein
MTKDLAQLASYDLKMPHIALSITEWQYGATDAVVVCGLARTSGSRLERLEIMKLGSW